MEVIEAKFCNQLYSDMNKEKTHKQKKYSSENKDYKSKLISNSSSKKKEKNLFNFISSKSKIKLKSNFDKKGAKKFLHEKSKAMEEIVLIDDAVHDEHHYKKKTSPNKKSKQYRSEKALLQLKLNKFSNKKNNVIINADKNQKNLMSSQTLGLLCISDVKDIGKIKNKKTNKKGSLESIKYKSSCFNQKEAPYLLTSDNDSLINTIVNQFNELKN